LTLFFINELFWTKNKINLFIDSQKLNKMFRLKTVLLNIDEYLDLNIFEMTFLKCWANTLPIYCKCDFLSTILFCLYSHTNFYLEQKKVFYLYEFDTNWKISLHKLKLRICNFPTIQLSKFSTTDKWTWASPNQYCGIWSTFYIDLKLRNVKLF